MTSSTEIDEIIEKVVAKLVAEYAPQKIILFGSYAYGTPHADSDIDLLIIKDTSERFIDRWATVRKILSDSNRLVALETIVLTPEEVAKRLSRGDQFVQEMVEKGKVLYAA